MFELCSPTKILQSTYVSACQKKKYFMQREFYTCIFYWFIWQISQAVWIWWSSVHVLLARRNLGAACCVMCFAIAPDRRRQSFNAFLTCEPKTHPGTSWYVCSFIKSNLCPTLKCAWELIRELATLWNIPAACMGECTMKHIRHLSSHIGWRIWMNFSIAALTLAM